MSGFYQVQSCILHYCMTFILDLLVEVHLHGLIRSRPFYYSNWLLYSHVTNTIIACLPMVEIMFLNFTPACQVFFANSIRLFLRTRKPYLSRYCMYFLFFLFQFSIKICSSYFEGVPLLSNVGWRFGFAKVWYSRCMAFLRLLWAFSLLSSCDECLVHLVTPLLYPCVYSSITKLQKNESCPLLLLHCVAE